MLEKLQLKRAYSYYSLSFAIVIKSSKSFTYFKVNLILKQILAANIIYIFDN